MKENEPIFTVKHYDVRRELTTIYRVDVYGNYTKERVTPEGEDVELEDNSRTKQYDQLVNGVIDAFIPLASENGLYEIETDLLSEDAYASLSFKECENRRGIGLDVPPKFLATLKQFDLLCLNIGGGGYKQPEDTVLHVEIEIHWY